MIVVADAGPLLHLYWIGVSDWALPPEPVHVVEEVWEEVSSHAPEALWDPRLVRCAHIGAIPEAVLEWNLDAGEREALAYALSQTDHEGVLLLSDDGEARSACVALGVGVVGSVGLVVRAHREGRVALRAAEAALQELPSRGRLHVRPEVIEYALTVLRGEAHG
jgi:predicted nucleic acid-binding protein